MYRLVFYLIALLEFLWRCVLFFKEFLFSNNFFSCRTFFELMHKVLWQYESYRDISTLALGPDDEMWRKIGIPYVASRWPDGSLDLTIPLHISDQMRTEMHGKFFGTYEGRTPVMVISDTGMIEEFLNNTIAFTRRRVYFCGDNMHDNMLPMISGPRWMLMRRLITDRFTLDVDIKRAVQVTVNCASVSIERLRSMASEPKLVKCGRKMFEAFSMDVMGKMMFGRSFRNHVNPDNEFTKNASKLLIEGRELVLRYMVRYPELFQSPEYCVFDPKAMNFFRQYIITFLSQRMVPGTDFVQSLEDAVHRQQISMDDLYANVTILLALSYHSVSFVLAVICWELSRNQDMQNRLIAEIDTCIKGYGILTHREVDAMDYLDQIIREALRKYPPAVRIERVCRMDTTLLTTPVKKGTVVAIPLFTLHHNPEVYPEPLLFNPDRFAHSKYPFGYNWLPFGGGHRKCVVWKFALMEIKVFMAYLLSQIRLSASDDKAPLVFQSKKNILVADRIPFKIQRRLDRVWIPGNEIVV